jgi:hypothetical protein
MSNRELKVTQSADLTSVVLSTTVGFTANFSQVRGAQAVWTSTTLSGSVQLQYSLNNTDWIDVEAATSITNTSATKYWDITNTNIDPLYWRVNVVRSSGTYTTLKVYFANISR